MDLVSVIIPVFNVKDYLDECLKTVTNQTYDQLEIILIDDESTDGSGQMCDGWTEKDSRIHVIHQKNQGLSGARNAGLDACTGEWITFIDSDDIVAKTYVEELLKLVKKTGANLAQGKQVGFANHDDRHPSVGFEQLNDEIEMAENRLGQDSMWSGDSKDYMLSSAYQTMAWGKLYKRELFKTKRFPVGKLHEDNAIVYRLAYEAKRVAYTKRILYGYRRRQNSIMGEEGYNLRHLDKQEFLKERLDFFIEKQEKELANLARKEYAFELLEEYGKVKKYHPDEKAILHSIQHSYQKVADDVVKNSDLSLKTKLLMRYAKHNPGIWTRVFGEA